MRPPNKSRSRNKNNRRNNNSGGGNILNRVYDSAGPDGRVRGTPVQVIEKYQALAHDHSLAGDRVAMENFQQHAEHYIRMINDVQRQVAERRESMENQNRGNPDNNGAQRNNNQDNTDRRARGDAHQDPASAEQPDVIDPKAIPDMKPPENKVEGKDTSETIEVNDAGQLVDTPEDTPTKPKATKPKPKRTRQPKQASENETVEEQAGPQD